MRSPPHWHTFVFLSTLILIVYVGTVEADVPGEITGVSVSQDGDSLVISFKGDPGKVAPSVIPRPNRLVLDFANGVMGKVPPTMAGNQAGIHAIRAANYKNRARVVADFQDAPVPEFSVKREKNQVRVVLGQSDPEKKVQGRPKSSSDNQEKIAAAGIRADATAEREVDSKKSTVQEWLSEGFDRELAWAEPAEANSRKSESASETAEQPAGGEQTLAQATESSQGTSRPPASLPMRQIQPADKPDASRSRATAPSGPPFPRPRDSRGTAKPGNGPPITPPEPDPRLLAQELTELKFIQVGHNSRLYICGGDHLDYRLDRVSETKLKLDLINAEIPKVFQKPLRTNLFATSVEMIIPGSQTIFIQLKEPAPYKVEKKKGVLMVDFSPPRFELTADMKAAGKPIKPGAAAPLPGPAGARGAAASASTGDPSAQDEPLECESSVDCLKKRIEEWGAERDKRRKYTLSPSSDVLEKTVTMDFQDIKLKNAFRLLSEQAGVNITLDPEVDGKTTLRLQNVPLRDVINTILVTNDLSRVMVGDVLRIGTKKKIKEFLDENNAAIQALDQRIAADRNKIKALEDRKRKEENPSPIEGSIRTEEIGEAGCIKVGEEEICFFYATVRLTYAQPKDVVKTLDCMFNLNCPGTGQGASSANDQAGSVADQTAKRDARLDDLKTKLQDQGFSADSPGGINRVAAAETLDLDRQRTDATTARTDALRSRVGLTGETTAGQDPRLRQIIANSTLWPDSVNKMIFIKDTSERITQMKKVIRSLDVPNAQVLIESRLVRASRDWIRGLGIIWGGRNNQNGQVQNTKTAFWGITGNQNTADANTPTQPSTPPIAGTMIPSRFAVNLPIPFSASTLASDMLGLGMQFGLLGTQYMTELDFRLQLAEKNEQAKTIARPKVQVLDGKPALIKDGADIPYATTSAMQGTQTQLVPAYLELKVTPTIFSDGRISMDLNVKDDEIGPNIASLGQTQPTILRREAKTNMVVKDGETAVIGGIIRERDNTNREGWPGLMNIPLVGFFFSNKGRQRGATELLIFITPTIIKRPPLAS